MAYDFRNITVLVVENTQAMFEITKSVLMTFGVNAVHYAFDYKQGYRNFCRIKPDLVVMDWLEEPMNGLELTKKIRSDPDSPNPFVPIILMTGHSSTKRVMMARDSGITTLMAKPYNAKMLYNRIELLVEKPKPFVKSESFIGPDRRHLRDPAAYVGPERRTEADLAVAGH